MDTGLKNKLKDDLQKTGFHSELMARQTLESILCGNDETELWTLDPAGVYFDKDQNKSREIDIVAYAETFMEHLNFSHVSVYLLCEVKKSKTPWIVFKNRGLPQVQSLAWSPQRDERYVEPIMKEVGATLDNVVGWRGAGIHEAFKTPSQPSRWYSAFSSITKAAVELRNEVSESEDDEYLEDHDQSTSMSLEVFQPVVIFDGMLVSAELEDGEIQLSEVPYVSVSFDYRSVRYNQTKKAVDLVTLNGLREYSNIVEHRMGVVANGVYNCVENISGQKYPDRSLYNMVINEEYRYKPDED